ncbi:hypothetical protein HMPREF3213_03427 [Heyndrickxia coagulans]|jgi:hypothetical protein|uniref:Uncharacterized protein n=1 Tax=Heyndrickxia coagulans TaxID=1398 RepID=A0A133KCC3_HEYCO|nr:hypothetical protein HMPREF3213_03427 [Heyndrickxia coagulans]
MDQNVSPLKGQTEKIAFSQMCKRGKMKKNRTYIFNEKQFVKEEETGFGTFTEPACAGD